jgi:hypothetical protein
MASAKPEQSEPVAAASSTGMGREGRSVAAVSKKTAPAVGVVEVAPVNTGGAMWFSELTDHKIARIDRRTTVAADGILWSAATGGQKLGPFSGPFFGPSQTVWAGDFLDGNIIRVQLPWQCRHIVRSR